MEEKSLWKFIMKLCWKHYMKELRIMSGRGMSIVIPRGPSRPNAEALKYLPTHRRPYPENRPEAVILRGNKTGLIIFKWSGLDTENIGGITGYIFHRNFPAMTTRST